MKKLVVALMLLSLSVVSCGKNNSTNSGTAGVSNPITTSIQGASQIGAMIDNYGQYFGSAQASYYMTYLQMVNQGANLKYHYTKTASASSNSNCSLKWGIFYVCSSSSTSSTTSNVTESKLVENNAVTILTKQNELKGYINTALQITQSGTATYIYTNQGKYIVIDTRYPIQAQPVGIQDSTGNEYLYNITL
jgi:hypothetical protein